MASPGQLRFLVVYKKSQLMLYREHQPETLAEIERREPKLLAKFIEVHEENSQAIRRIRGEIEKRGIEATFRYRANHQRPDRYDLVISVGGDGTLLDVAHHVLHTAAGRKLIQTLDRTLLCNQGRAVRRLYGHLPRRQCSNSGPYTLAGAH